MTARTATWTILIVAAWSILAAGVVAPTVLIKVDLSRRADFDRAASLSLTPVYRVGNEFYIAADTATLARLGSARLGYQVLTREPFVDGYLYVADDSASAGGELAAKSGGQILDQTGHAVLWKTSQPLPTDQGDDHHAPIPITEKTIPLVYLAALTMAGPMTDDPILDTIVARISPDSVLAFGTRLVDFKTRYVYTDSNIAAREYLRQKFLSFGYTDVVTDTFDVEYKPGVGHNVICTKRGVLEPDKVIVIGAHFDSHAFTDPSVAAPGANDNASGTVGVLEIARVLATIPTSKTIVFIAFNAEEEFMYGSYFYANRAAASGMNIEVMLNMDMIGYDPDSSGNTVLFTDSTSLGYADLVSRMASRGTRILAGIRTRVAPSDELPFYERGYHVVFAIEDESGYPGYHNNTDQIYRLNLGYWTDMIRMIGMTAYSVAQSAPSVENVQLRDIGDGQSLEVRWQPVLEPGIAEYRIHSGLTSGNYTSNQSVAATDPPVYQLTGLTEGQMYYVTVTAVDGVGRESAVRSELHMAPRRAPHPPDGVAALAEYHRIGLTWGPATDLDFDHFAILRGTDSVALDWYVPSIVACAFTDTLVNRHARYFYRIAAVDHDGNVGEASRLVSGIPATFDRDLLVVDMTSSDPGDPSEADQWSVYNAIFSDFDHWYYRVDSHSALIDRSVLGQYKTVFWLDDGNRWQQWAGNQAATVNWYLSYGNNLVITGWNASAEAAQAQILYDVFHVDTHAATNIPDCLGGWGVAGFPKVAFDTARVGRDGSGRLSNVGTVRLLDQSPEVILRYHSANNIALLTNQPLAIRRDAGSYKAALVSLPLYYLRTNDAANLVGKLAAWFGCTPKAMGDLSGDDIVNVFDIISVIGIVYEGAPLPDPSSRADFNSDCVVDLLDVRYLIRHVFENGPAPTPGCGNGSY